METVYLEHWIHNLIKKKLSEDPEYRQFAGKDAAHQISRVDIDLYQLFKLRKIVSYAYEKSTFYRELFNRIGLRADDINSLDDLAGVPFTNPADIAQHPYHFACVSLGDIARITTFTSSGTIGPQKRIFFTDGDLETMTDFMAAGMRTVAEEGDVVMIMLPSSRPNDQADLLAKGVRKMGGLPIISGVTRGPEEQLKLIDEYHPAVLFAYLPFLYRITQETRHTHDLKEKGVKVLFVTAEHLSESIREQLKTAWNCEVHAHYGLTEMGLGVSVDCHAHDGFHYNEADLLVEVVDIETGAVLGDGEEGELVFTTLSREAMPLIRYRTHDISRLIGTPCECGASTLKKIADVTRRLESTLKIYGGDEIYPSLFDDAILTDSRVIDYQLVIRRDMGREALIFKVEVTGKNENIEADINTAISNHPLIKRNLESNRIALPRVELVGQGTLTRLNRAKKLITDER